MNAAKLDTMSNTNIKYDHSNCNSFSLAHNEDFGSGTMWIIFSYLEFSNQHLAEMAENDRTTLTPSDTIPIKILENKKKVFSKSASH